MNHAEVVLQKDCPATVIPAGDAIVLQAGKRLTITQALGGSVTLRDAMGLYRVEPVNLDALGAELAAQVRQKASEEARAAASASAAGAVGTLDSDAVWGALRECYDPEIPINIVDLGLIYDLQIIPAKDGDNMQVDVKMTLTAQGCGMGPHIAADARNKILALPGVADANVEIVWDPVWTPHMISPEGRKKLGLDQG